MHKVYIAIHRLDYTNIDDRYVYTGALIMIWLQVRVKTADYCKTKASSHTCSNYKNRWYLEPYWASSRPLQGQSEQYLR